MFQVLLLLVFGGGFFQVTMDHLRELFFWYFSRLQICPRKTFWETKPPQMVFLSSDLKILVKCFHQGLAAKSTTLIMPGYLGISWDILAYPKKITLKVEGSGINGVDP